ncbi:MAG: hypothetical protein AAF401_13225 [Pseudomonadota bacterium]
MRSLSLLICLAVAACASGPSVTFGAKIYRIDVDNYYSIAEASVFAAAGGPTVIQGSPRGGWAPNEVAAQMRLPAHLNPRIVTPVEKGRPGLRLVMVFSPTVRATSEQVCAGEARGAEAGETMRVFGAYCTGERRVISEAILETAGSPQPGDPEFASAMSQLVNALLPVVAPADRDGRDCVRPGCG